MSSRPTDNTNHYHYSQTYSSSKASFKGCCCCLFFLLTFFALLIIAAFLVIWLAVKPKKPQIDLNQVSVQIVGINSNDAADVAAAASASVPLCITMVFSVSNDNKLGIKYAESGFTVMYHGIPLGRGSVPAFYQPAHSIRRVNTTIFVDRVSLLQTDTEAVLRDAAVNDRVDLRVVGDAGAKILIFGLSSPEVQVSVDCRIVISPRKQALTSKQCKFDGLGV